MENFSASMLISAPPVPLRVMIAHPEAGEIAYFLRQAAGEHLPQLVRVEYCLVGQPGGLSFEAFGSCQVMLISHPFYRQLRLYTFTHLPTLLGLAVIVLDEPGLSPAARDVIQAVNSGAQGWYTTPYRPETAVNLLWRLHALLPADQRSRLMLPEAGPLGPRPN